MKSLVYVHNANFDLPSANKDQVSAMVTAFSKEKLKVTLLSFSTNIPKMRRDFAIDKRVSIDALFPPSTYTLRTLKLVRYFKDKYDEGTLVYTRDLLFCYLLKLFSPKAEVIYELHEIPKKRSWHILFRKTYKYLDSLVVISQGLKMELIDMGFDSSKITVLHDGVDIDEYVKVKKSKQQLRKEMNIPEKKIVMYAGGLQEWKGFRTFLEASRELRLRKDILFVFIGGSEEELKHLKINYPEVLFLGRTPYKDLPKYSKCADLLIIPNSGKDKISTTYTSPLKLFAHMASKVPIIISDLPSMREVVNEKEVIFFRADDKKDLALKITAYLKEESKYKSMPLNAYEKVKAYTWKKRVSSIIKLYDKKA